MLRQRLGRLLHPSYVVKITIVSLLLIMGPFLFTSLSAGRRFFNYLEEKSVDSADQIIRNLNRYLEQFFSELNNLTILPLYDGEVIRVLKNHGLESNRQYVTSEESRRISSYLTSLRYSKNEMEVLFFTLDGNILGTGEMGYRLRWEDKPRWMELAEQNPTSSLIMPYDAADAYYPTAQMEDGFLTVSRYLQEPLFQTPIGYIQFIIQPNYLNEFLDTVNFTKDSRLLIYNSFGQQVYPAGPPLALGEPEGGRVSIEGVEYVASSVTSASTRLRFLALISLDDLRRDMFMVMSKFILVVCVALAVSCLLAVLASLRVSRPIVRLKDRMLLVGQGHFDTRSPVESNDEVGQLQRMFNDMTANLEHMIHAVYEASIAEKDAQIAALQAQINPHFLYNTLETINMMAVNAEKYDISLAVSSLGRMMRYCVDNESFFVTLAEEARFITTYFDILKLRHEDMRSLCMNFTPEARDAEVPKLILQPFVENVAKHALENGPVDVRLNAEVEGDMMLITIQNNGRALAREEADELRAKLTQGAKGRRSGYGISNVHRRLRLIYGADCGVTVDDTFGQGARFVLRFRLSAREGERHA